MVLTSLPHRVHLTLPRLISRSILTLTLIPFNMTKRLYSVALGPVVEGKPSKVEIVLADNIVQIVQSLQVSDVSPEILSIQVLPDIPLIL